MADPLLLWCVHLELDRRDVPPCLRWPQNDMSPQHEYIAWLADLAWLCRRYPAHRPAFRGWVGLFKHPIASPAWHATALRQFLFVRARYSLAHWCSKGLALSIRQRADLMTLPTVAMVADRRQLHRPASDATMSALLADARAHRDRAGKHAPERVAERRALLWRVYLLSSRNVTAMATRMQMVTGEAMTRQGAAKQIAAIKRALGR